ncbi:hypothetical protein ACFLU6_16620, partial [Acidobacteriota bacterium]
MLRREALFCILIVLMSHVAAAETIRYVPDPKKLAQSQIIDGKAIQYNGKALAIRAEILQPEERARFIASRLRRPIDPFAVVRDEEQFFLTILVQMQNRTPGRIYVNPSTSLLYRGDWFYSPLGYSMLYSYLETIVQDKDFMTRMLECIYDSPEILGPGQRISKLLVFSDVPDAKRLRLVIPSVGLGVE